MVFSNAKNHQKSFWVWADLVGVAGKKRKENFGTAIILAPGLSRPEKVTKDYLKPSEVFKLICKNLKCYIKLYRDILLS